MPFQEALHLEVGIEGAALTLTGSNLGGSLTSHSGWEKLKKSQLQWIL